MWRRLPEIVPSASDAKSWVSRTLPITLAVLVSATLIVGVVIGHGFITSSDRFAIRSLDVRGNHAVSDARIAQLLGVEDGDNIFEAGLDRMAQTLERDPWISDAMVRRGLPDTLIVEIEENRPATLVELGGLYLADARGSVFKRAAIERGEGAGLPIVTGLSRDDYIERPDDVQRAILQALDAMASYHDDETRPAVGEAHVHPRHGITLITRDNAVSVRLGRPGNGDEASMSERLHAFDLVWQALSPAERQRARAIYADDRSRSERVTVAFGEID